ncbi:MAG: hypothetical protein R3F55_23945 [Alphaproteobacteria bacterium]
MSFRLPDAWIWDFWFAKDGATYHMFYLRAPRSLGDPELRHHNAVIGHAASRNLVDWQDVGPCFGPARDAGWDDGPSWTGSIIRRDGLWHMFYTSTAQAEELKKQRIGLATSRDLHHWDRHPANPVLDLEPVVYEEYDPALWHDRAWRDPYVIPDPVGDGYRMFLTARVNSGPAAARGVIAQARSRDLVEWHMILPATTPGSFGQLEVPQFLRLGRRCYLLFSTAVEHVGPTLRAGMKPGAVHFGGTHYYMADHPNGPWHLGGAPFLSAGTETDLYSGKIVIDPQGAPVFLAFRDRDAGGRFYGEVSDPIPVRVHGDGRLWLDHTRAEAAPRRFA